MKKATPKKKARGRASRPPRTAKPLPPLQLYAIAAMLGEHHRPDELIWAYDVARRALREIDTEYSDVIHSAINTSARRGSFGTAIKAVEQWDVDQLGDLHNAYAIPALYIGMAVALLITGRVEGGDR